MCQIINFDKWKRARLGGGRTPPIDRRARRIPARRTGQPEFRSIGDLSRELLGKLRE